MQKYVIGDRAVVLDGEPNPTEELAKRYLDEVDHLFTEQGRDASAISTVKIFVEDGLDDVKVEVEYKNAQRFERIRRITGYLTGTVDRFNDAKRAEERERVKHGVVVDVGSCCA